MTAAPKFELKRLREIGWSMWDPIGIGAFDDCPGDEYDPYLVQAAGQVWRGHSDQEVADYVLIIETEHMGLSPEAGVGSRALAVAKAIRKYVDTLRI
jgi:hypothetical protein